MPYRLTKNNAHNLYRPVHVCNARLPSVGKVLSIRFIDIYGFDSRAPSYLWKQKLFEYRRNSHVSVYRMAINAARKREVKVTIRYSKRRNAIAIFLDRCRAREGQIGPLGKSRSSARHVQIIHAHARARARIAPLRGINVIGFLSEPGNSRESSRNNRARLQPMASVSASSSSFSHSADVIGVTDGSCVHR